MHHRVKDITGLRVGFLTALSYHGSDGKRSIWKAQCDCGKVILVPASEMKKQLNRGIVSSCGCKRKETIGKRNKTHGMTNHKVYAVWRSMLARCTNPNHAAWKNYGGRGIEVCQDWLESFEAFWRDMGPTYREGLTLDRRDNLLGYFPANCRWVTHKEQANNTRANVMVGAQTMAQFADAHGISRSNVGYRIQAGVPLHRLAEAPDVSRRFMTSSTVAPVADLFADLTTAPR